MLICSAGAGNSPEIRVAPGQTGKIPVRVNTEKLTGPFLKVVPVGCNDTNHPSIILEFKGTVWRPIEATPTILIFDAVTGTNETKIARIVNNTDEPVTLSAPECREPSFKAELKTVKPGKEFELRVTQVPQFAKEPVPASITIKTSYKGMPTLSIPIWILGNADPSQVRP